MLLIYLCLTTVDLQKSGKYIVLWYRECREWRHKKGITRCIKKRPLGKMWSTPLWAYFECGGTWGFNSERELCIRDFYGVRSVVEMWKNG